MNLTMNLTMNITMARQQGVVLLSVLLVVALLSAITIRLVSRHSLNVAQSSHSIGADLTLGYALGAETFAKQLLYMDETLTGQGEDNLTETWAQPLAPFPLEEYNNAFMEIQLRDLHSCFNLNNLAHTDPAVRETNHARLKMLLLNLGLPVALADAWEDWVDDNDNVKGYGAEGGTYLLQDPAYRAANQPAAHVTELALVAEIEPEQFARILPYVCVLPDTDSKLNVNTASTDVLNLFGTTPVPISEDPQPPTEPSTYKTVPEFLIDFPTLVSGKTAMTITSQYFELQTRVQIDGHITELTSVLHREPGTGVMRVISRDLGKMFRTRLKEDES
jgi:general secretion pathway protein K